MRREATADTIGDDVTRTNPDMADSRCTETRGDQREVNDARTRHYRTDKAGVNASATATERTRDPIDTVQHAPINGTPEKTETPDIVIHGDGQEREVQRCSKALQDE